jgi:hypothetical protein
MFSFDLTNLVKYVLEGLAVAVAAFFIPRKNINVQEIVLIALTAAATFAVLDMFTPFVGTSARQGAGFGIGYNMVTGGGLEGFDAEGFEGQEGGEEEGFEGGAPAADVQSVASEHSVPLGMDSAENLATF